MDNQIKINSRGWTDGGEWALMSDGTLHVIADGVLRRQSSFRAVKFKVHHLIIEGAVTEIEDRTFEDYHNMESVDFRVDELPMIGVNAFANCEKLNDIYLPDGMELSGIDLFFAFVHTPFAARYFGKDGDDSVNLKVSPCWQQFEQKLLDGISSLYNRNGEPLDLEKCLNVICDGCEKQDPMMLFLGARFCEFFSRERYPYPFTFSRKMDCVSGNNAFPLLEESEVRDLYVQAAEAGSLHALFWCAWCNDEGRWPFSRNQEKSQYYLEKASVLMTSILPNAGYETLYDFLRMKELVHLLRDQLEQLDDYTHDVDIRESLCDEGEVLPDPDWRELSRRIAYLQYFARSFGLAMDGSFRSRYFTLDPDSGTYDSDVELSWVNWCAKHLA